MDLTRLQELAYLEKLKENKSLLIEEIETTKGYVLTKLKLSDLLPEVNFLMDNLTQYNIQFVIDNYSLDNTQKEKILKFVTDASDEKNTVSINLLEKEVNQYLRKKILLPKTTILSVEQINQFQKEIKNQYKIKDNYIQRILDNSLGKFSVEDFFKIDKDFLRDKTYLMDVYSNLSNKEYRKLYKELVLSNKDYIHDIKEFKNYYFEKDEKNFLLELLKNSSSWGINSYAEMSSIRGFSSLIEKDEYFDSFNSKSLKDYSQKETEDKIDFIQSVWLNKELPSYNIFNDFLYKTCSVKQFITLMNKDFMMKIINKSNSSRILGDVSKESEEIAVKCFHLNSNFLDLFANQALLKDGATITSKTQFYEIFKLIEDLKESRYLYHNKNHPEFEKLNINNEVNIEKIFKEIIPQYLKNDGIYSLLSNSKDILTKQTIKQIDSMVDNNSNINMFFWLSSAHFDWTNKNGYRAESISQELEIYLRKIHQKILTKTADVTDEVFKNNISASLIIIEKFSSNSFIKNLKKNYGILKKEKYLLKDENIFFAYEGKKLTDINEKLWSITAALRPEFYDEIIKRKDLAPNTFIYDCLNNSDNKKQREFLKSYVGLHRKEIELDENVLSRFLSSPNQQEIFPRSFNEENIYKELLEKIEQEDSMSQERISIENLKKEGAQRLYSRKDLNLPEIDIEKFDEKAHFNYKSASKIDIQTRYVDLYQKEQLLNGQQKKLKGSLSFEFMQEKFKFLIEEKDFKQIAYLKDEGMLSSHNGLLVEFINGCSYKNLIEYFKDKDFLNLFKSQINYENVTEIKLDNFSNQENNKIAKILIKLFKDDSKKVFYFFAEENRKFIKNFVIENLPENLFYSYSFLVKTVESYNPTNFVNEPYTNEEIYKAFKKLDDNEGFFCNTDVNSRANTFFSDTFSVNSHNKDEKLILQNRKQGLERYLNFLDFAKEKDLKLYVLAAHSDCFINTLGWGKKDEAGNIRTRDHIIHDFFMENFDFDLILKGMKQIVDEMKKRSGAKFNSNNASGAIISIIHNTYYEQYDKNSASSYHSNMSHENTKKLFKFLFEEAPMICVERHRIGGALEPEKFFRENVQDIVNVNNIESFLYPDSRVSAQYLRVFDKGDQQDRLLSFFSSIINNAMENKDSENSENSETLEYLMHLVNQKDFLSNKISHSGKRKLNEKNNDYSSDIFMEVIQKNSDTKGLLKTLIFKNKLDKSLDDKKQEIGTKKNKI